MIRDNKAKNKNKREILHVSTEMHPLPSSWAPCLIIEFNADGNSIPAEMKEISACTSMTPDSYGQMAQSYPNQGNTGYFYLVHWRDNPVLELAAEG